MFLMEAHRATELREQAEAEPIDVIAIWDAVIMGEPLPEGLTLDRLALEYILLKQSLTAADFCNHTHHELRC